MIFFRFAHSFIPLLLRTAKKRVKWSVKEQREIGHSRRGGRRSEKNRHHNIGAERHNTRENDYNNAFLLLLSQLEPTAVVLKKIFANQLTCGLWE